MLRLAPRIFPLLLIPALSILASGCGHSEEEWQAQLEKFNRLTTEHQASQKELADAKKHVEDLEKQLQSMGVDLQEKDKKVSTLSASLEEQARALAEYK